MNSEPFVDSKGHRTPSLRRSPNESPDQFMTRMNQLGYANGSLEKATAHWNRDHSEYHAGDYHSCKSCRHQAKTLRSDAPESDNLIPLKTGKIMRRKDGLASILLYFPAAFTERIAATPLSHIHVILGEGPFTSEANEGSPVRKEEVLPTSIPTAEESKSAVQESRHSDVTAKTPVLPLGSLDSDGSLEDELDHEEIFGVSKDKNKRFEVS